MFATMRGCEQAGDGFPCSNGTAYKLVKTTLTIEKIRSVIHLDKVDALGLGRDDRFPDVWIHRQDLAEWSGIPESRYTRGIRLIYDVRQAREILITKDLGKRLSKEEKQDLDVFEAILSYELFSRDSKYKEEKDAGSWTVAKLKNISSFHAV